MKTSPSKRPSRLLLYGPLAIGALILAGWYGLWREGASVMRAELAAFAETQRAAGADVQYRSIKTKGFPFYLRGAAEGFSITYPETGAAYATDVLYVDALPYALDRIIFSAPKAQSIDFGDVRLNVRAPNGRASISGPEANGSDGAPGRAWRLKSQSGQVSVAAEGLRGDAGPANGFERLTIKNATLNAAPAPGDPTTVEIGLVADALGLQFNGDSVAAADRIEAFIVVSNAGSPNGTTIDIRGLAVDADDARIALAGELSLDADGYPRGRLDAEIVNPLVLPERLATLGVLGAEEADALAGALGLAALAGGGKVRAPIEFEGATVRIMGVAFAAPQL